MKSCSYILILLAIFAAESVQAGVVEKCVDSSGKVTYTDKGCKGKETSQDAYLIGTSTNQHHKKPESTTMNRYRVAEIGILTEQAVEQCGKQASKYFSGSHPGVTEKSESEFQSVVDRSLQGENVEIVLAGVIRINGEKDAEEVKIQCTATRSRETEWVLVFKETSAQSISTTAAAKP
jgi:hypothetical protein